MVVLPVCGVAWLKAANQQNYFTAQLQMQPSSAITVLDPGRMPNKMHHQNGSGVKLMRFACSCTSQKGADK